MCTVSWKFAVAGYDLFFNRDEQRLRNEASPPRIIQQNGKSVIAPQDTNAGGTWLAVNEQGITSFLLNHYPSASQQFAESRGKVVFLLMGAESRSEAEQLIESLPLHNFAPFRAGVCIPGAGSFTWLWNGTILRNEGSQDKFLTSSSYQSEQVVASRKNLFEAINPSCTEDYLDLHSSHFPSKGPLSVCVHRSDAQTVSFSHIRVRRKQITFHYFPGSPCRSAKGHTVVLDRKFTEMTERAFRVA